MIGRETEELAPNDALDLANYHRTLYSHHNIESVACSACHEVVFIRCTDMVEDQTQCDFRVEIKSPTGSRHGDKTTGHL